MYVSVDGKTWDAKSLRHDDLSSFVADPGKLFEVLERTWDSTFV
jgi:hypothetical protein